MTNLTSEQYREVLRHVPNITEEIPTCQQLLRRAVETFFNRFGAYPELAGVAPGKIALFGEQTQFADGLALPAATPMMTIIVGRKVPGSLFSVVTSADVGKPHLVKFSFSKNRPLHPSFPIWLNYIKGAIDNYPKPVPPFEAAIESSIPMGVGFGSSSAIEVATYSFLEILVGEKGHPIEKAKACQLAEKYFIGKEVGLVDRITSVLAKDRKVMLIDCKTNEVKWIPFRNKRVALVAVNSHLEDTLYGYEYPERSKYIMKACEMLQVENLRGCTEDDIVTLENRVNEILTYEEEMEEEEEEEEEEGEEEEESKEEEELFSFKQDVNVWSRQEYQTMIKRARFFVTEMNRIREALEAWATGDIVKFGEKLKESHESLMEDFDFNNPILNFLVEASLEAEGVLGSRMIGMGLGYGGGVVSLVKTKSIERYCIYITEKFKAFKRRLMEDLKQTREEEQEKQIPFNKPAVRQNLSAAKKSAVEMPCKETYKGPINKICSPKPSGCIENKKELCIVKLHRRSNETENPHHLQKYGKIWTFEKLIAREKERKEREQQRLERDSADSYESKASVVELSEPSFYIISPFAGARMMFVTKTDLLRSRLAHPIPHPKVVIRSALEEYKKVYGNRPEAVGVAPGTICLFGEFLQYHLGYVICMALPLYCVVAGGRNDSVLFSIKTTSKEVEEPFDMKYPIPCVQKWGLQSRTWVNYVLNVIKEFKEHVPGFNAIINSTVPMQFEMNSSSAIQASMYLFLEELTKSGDEDFFTKADKCARSQYYFIPDTDEHTYQAATVKFLPTFVCQEGHLLLIDCKKYEMSQHFFDHPSYAFLIACVKKNDTKITIETLEDRLKQCLEALDILGRESLINSELKHIRCLEKRDASETVVKRARHIITEQKRIVELLQAIKYEKYERVGLLMNESHASLRDDYEVSSPQIEELIQLALSVEGVLGAKMVGQGMKAIVVILAKLSDADKCIQYVQKNYTDKSDKPVFYIIKPSEGAFTMNPKLEVPFQYGNSYYSPIITRSKKLE